jgi:hypothetical protein
MRRMADGLMFHVIRRMEFLYNYFGSSGKDMHIISKEKIFIELNNIGEEKR